MSDAEVRALERSGDRVRLHAALLRLGRGRERRWKKEDVVDIVGHHVTDPTFVVRARVFNFFGQGVAHFLSPNGEGCSGWNRCTHPDHWRLVEAAPE